jgi:predicted ATP-dependent protease
LRAVRHRPGKPHARNPGQPGRLLIIVSLLTGRRISKDIAMTGEISLRGLVLPVGGIKEKMLAAKRAGIACVLLPEFNRRDLAEIPSKGRAGIRFEFLRTADEALRFALEAKDPAVFAVGEPHVEPAIAEQRVNGSAESVVV